MNLLAHTFFFTQLLTEYQKEFIAKRGLKDKAMGPNKGLIVSKARSSSMTTNRADFVVSAGHTCGGA